MAVSSLVTEFEPSSASVASEATGGEVTSEKAWRLLNDGNLLPSERMRKRLTKTQRETVELKGVQLGDDGAARLAEELVTDTVVRKLSLTQNEIGYLGAGALADMVRHVIIPPLH